MAASLPLPRKKPCLVNANTLARFVVYYLIDSTTRLACTSEPKASAVDVARERHLTAVARRPWPNAAPVLAPSTATTPSTTPSFVLGSSATVVRMLLADQRRRRDPRTSQPMAPPRVGLPPRALVLASSFPGLSP